MTSFLDQYGLGDPFALRPQQPRRSSLPQLQTPIDLPPPRAAAVPSIESDPAADYTKAIADLVRRQSSEEPEAINNILASVDRRIREMPTYDLRDAAPARPIPAARRAMTPTEGPDTGEENPNSAPLPIAQEFVQMMLPHAQRVSQQYGVDPRLVIAQAALETGYGRHAPGGNYFGIKGPGQVLDTKEAGPGGLYGTRASFRTYKNPGESADDYGRLLSSSSRYAPVLAARTLEDQIAAMGRSGYATDPDYAAKLRRVASSLPALARGGLFTRKQ